MVPNRNQRAPGVAPGEPEAPVAAPQAAPAPRAPDRTTEAANEDAKRVPETRDGQRVPEAQDAKRVPEAQDGQRVPEAQDGQAVPEPEVEQTPEDECASVTELDEVAAKAAKADQYLELAQRTKADFENYRKRAAREAAAAQERGIAKLARELLPAVDNLDRALAAVEDDAEHDVATLVSGIKLVHADVIAALARVGIERFSPEGERFDPQRHEAIAQQPVEGAEPGTIVEVYQRGYALGDFVIRPARVVVAG
jgi:molecular chaperone GrpE